MKGLLLRLWYGIRIGVLPGAACILILSLISPDTAAFVMPFAGLGIAVSLCPVIGADAASGFERYRLTLPVKRRTIADAYYLTILVLTVILVLFALLLLVWTGVLGRPLSRLIRAVFDLLFPIAQAAFRLVNGL